MNTIFILWKNKGFIVFSGNSLKKIKNRT